ncbi:uncharacterized protein LOC124675735 [Lolium rigidum]|uniref:uncharacterized protein LOC124675735 n=1 Tax=Lolium rigidum TaxID=89674 RepID=UPI001F5C1C32|nr:uncharacterized protein LOC124675735 [Lolium rigidum]
MACKVTTLLDIKNADIYVAEAEILCAMRARNAREDRSRTPMISVLVAAKYILMLCVAFVVGLSTYVCFAISVARLVQRDYGDAGGDAANKAKLEAALDIFYALVLIQTAFRIYWAVLGSQDLCTPVSDECGFAGWGPKLVRRYEADTQISCNKEEPLPRGWNLITYAVVLLESASLDDRLSGARVLDTFVEQGILVRKELLSSRQSVQNLMGMIDSRGVTAHDSEIRERAGRIVAHIAGDLLTTQFPARYDAYVPYLKQV